MVERALGQLLRQARLEAGFSGAQLARLIGRSQPYISDLERGQRTPSLPTLQSIAAALGKPASFFLDADHTLARAEGAATAAESPRNSAGGCFLVAAGHVADKAEARRLSQAMAAMGVHSFIFDSRRDMDHEQLMDMVGSFLGQTVDRVAHAPRSRIRYEDFEDVPRRRRLNREDLE